MTYLHIGAGSDAPGGFINTDKTTLDITKEWNYKDSSVDGIVSMHLLSELNWQQLIFAFKEMYRVLKPGGAMRHGVSDLYANKPLEHVTGWNNINIITYSVVSHVLFKVGFKCTRKCAFKNGTEPLAQLDNRPDHTMYFEAYK